MSRQLRQVAWLTLSALLIGFPLFTHAAEAPGALTVIVKDRITARPLSSVQITITERETGSTQSAETDSQGRIVVEQLDPGLYAVTAAKGGFVSSYQPSVRVITRKNVRIEFALRE
ncbi:MAG TPA: carboxypeptidase-like regulatory domain-containing protein, partial [Gammaproteobacteria bacterium]